MTSRQSVLLLAAGSVLITAVAVVPAQAATSTTSTPTLTTKPVATTAVKAASSKKRYWKTKYCYGRTHKVADGDTVEVKLTKGCFGWKKGKVVIVRNAAIQATEVAHPGLKAECWGNEARRVMRKEFPKKSRVRLGAYAKTASGEKTSKGQTRYVMYAYSYHPKTKGGPWIDAQAKVVSAGLAFPKGEHVESAHNIKYLRLAQQAVAQRKGMWGNVSKCGTHTPTAKLKAWTGWKTNGQDGKVSPNTEWFKVRNVGTVSVPLYGWKVRDGSHSFGGGKSRWFTIKQRATLKPGQTMTLFPGKGTNDPANLRWYNNHPRLPFYKNSSPGTPSDKSAPYTKKASNYGHSTILMDPSGNFRAQSMYPCVYNCVKPTVRIMAVDPVGGRSHDETATIKNVGSSTADLTGVVVQISSARYEFRPGTTLAPGAYLQVHFARSGTDTASNAYFGHDSDGRLSTRGGKIWLRTADATTLSMFSYGNGGSYAF